MYIGKFIFYGYRKYKYKFSIKYKVSIKIETCISVVDREVVGEASGMDENIQGKSQVKKKRGPRTELSGMLRVDAWVQEDNLPRSQKE